MRYVVRFVTMLVLVLSLGLHWALLQTVAWTGMIINYSGNSTFAEGVNKTFDGNHPCCLCKAIQQARADEKQAEAKQKAKPGSKLDTGLVWQSALYDFACGHERIPYRDTDASTRLDEPPKPRPRAA